MIPCFTIVRETYSFNDRMSMRVVREDIAQTRAKALEIAALHGIERPHITEMYDGEWGWEGPPMYLLGPNGHPSPKTPEEALHYAAVGMGHGARYIIVIRNQDYVDYLDGQH